MANVYPLKEGTILKGKLDYRITSQLGHGGFGITYLAEAHQTVDGIPHALKFCIKEFFLSDKCSRGDSGWVNFNTDEKTVKNGKSDFKAEAETLKGLNDVPGIVPVKEVIEANNTVYYVMQFLEGKTLDKKIHEDGRLSESNALPIIEKVGRALSKLHDKKMTHLDVKPENIMLVEDFGTIQPVLIDFGLSRSYNMFGWESSGKKVFAISEGYSPVEQYGIINGFTPEADVYALAATLFHMLTGEVPKPSKDITDNYVRETLKKYGVSEKVENAIACAMRKEMGDRTSSVKQFLNILGKSSSSQGDGTKRLDDLPTPNPSKMKYYLIAVAVALVAVLFLLFGGGDKDGGGGKTEPIKIPDTPTMAELTVTCGTPDADVYINDELKGNSSWTGSLAAGSYQIEARKTGFVSQKKTVTLAEGKSLNVELPALIASSGKLSVNYKPQNAEVWIDGAKKGISPNTFDNLAVGNHTVEIRSNGYQSKTETVTIAEGKTATLDGSLTKVSLTGPTHHPSTNTLKIGDYATWQGGVKNGKPHGQGTMIFTKSHQIDSNCAEVAKAGDTVTGTYVDGHLDNGTWQSPGKPDKFLLLGN